MQSYKLIFLILLIISSSVTYSADQFVSILSYRIGPYASGGKSFYGGLIDYMNLTNLNGGINGVKLIWEECETEYNASRGVECYERLKNKYNGASVVEPLSTGIAYGILDRVSVDKIPMTTLGYGKSDAKNGKVYPYVFPLITSYWSQATAMIRYLGQKSGGMDKLKGKKIVHLYHDSAYGKEPLPVLMAESKKHDFQLIKIPIAPPGMDQQSQWLRIRKVKPDFVITWTFGVMSTVAMKTAQRTGFPRNKMLGVWWSGSEEDTIPAGSAAKNYETMTFINPGDYPLIKEINEKLYQNNKGNLEDESRVTYKMYMKGVVAGVMMVEAMRIAQKKYGIGKVISGEQMRWGLENLNIDLKRQTELGVKDLFPTLKTSCLDHEGSGAAKAQKWDGKKWVSLSKNWIIGDKDLIKKLVDESSNKYAKEKKIKPKCL
tara:strand:+ start:50 stop:1345 length:1296 start_codon:yes stop_codon:yes gene_type:complete